MEELSVDGIIAGRPIVEGVDGSLDSRAALAWAIDEARRRRVALEVVTAWHYPAQWAEGFNDRWADDEAALATSARGAAERSVAELLGETPRPTWISVRA